MEGLEAEAPVVEDQAAEEQAVGVLEVEAAVEEAPAVEGLEMVDRVEVAESGVPAVEAAVEEAPAVEGLEGVDRVEVAEVGGPAVPVAVVEVSGAALEGPEAEDLAVVPMLRAVGQREAGLRQAGAAPTRAVAKVEAAVETVGPRPDGFPLVAEIVAADPVAVARVAAVAAARQAPEAEAADLGDLEEEELVEAGGARAGEEDRARGAEVAAKQEEEPAAARAAGKKCGRACGPQQPRQAYPSM